MMNEEFMLLTEEEKQTKLRAALCRKSADCLTETELKDIIGSTPLKRQYLINVYFSEKDFRLHLALPDGVRGRTILGQVMVGSVEQSGDLYCRERAAAIITKDISNPDGTNQIHVYVPPERLEKGRKCV